MEEQREKIRKTIKWDHIFPFEDAREDQMNMIKAPLKYFSTFPVILLVAPNGKGKTATSIAIAMNKLQWNDERMEAIQSHNDNLAKLLEGENIEKVFFIDRTTRQTDNFIFTLNILNEKRKKHGIKPIRVVEWTSRNNLCINPYCLANKNSGIDYACKSTMRTDRWEKNKWCVDPDNSQTEIKIVDYVPNNIPIVADRKSLVKYGLDSNICPYYLSRQIQDKDSCDVIVGNYNYIFDPFTREAIQLNVQNSLIIVDESHNIEKVIESALKREITLPQVDNLLKNPKLGIEIIHFLKKVRLFIVAIMSLFEKRTINNHQTMINYNEFGENLKRYDINIEEIGKLSKALFALSTNMNLFQYLQRLVNIVSFFSIYFVFTSNAFISYAYKNENDTILGIQSFDIEPIVKTLIHQNCKILFMTGTIKPSMFQFQLGLEENVSIKTFVYPTPTRNMKTVIINKGVLGKNLSTDFINREETVIRDYGETLITLLEATPDSGSLIFFPSDPFKKQCITVWTKYGLMVEFGMKKYLINKKTNNKIPILDDMHTGEVSDGDNSNKIISQYKKFASTRKMVLFSIMRGRASEGEDYPNGEARSVFVIGIPLADVTSPSVSRKIEYYNNKKPNSGWEWLMSDAINAVNQAVGRMIRNDKKDYGVAYLLDARYVNDPSILPYLSDWIVERIDKNEISIPILQLNEKINKFYLQNQKKV